MNLADEKYCNLWHVHEVFRVNVRKICKERNKNDSKEYFILISLQLFLCIVWPTSYYYLLCWVRNTTVRLITHCLGLVYGLVCKVQEFRCLHNPSSTCQWYSRYCWRGRGKMATKANVCSSQNKQWKFSRDYTETFTEDTQLWKSSVLYYGSMVGELNKGRYRSIMDIFFVWF